MEALLLGYPSILDAAVVSAKPYAFCFSIAWHDANLQSEDGDEKPGAYVVRRRQSSLTEKDVISFVDTRVSKIKRLTGGVRFLDATPKNQVSSFRASSVFSHADNFSQLGKILRRKLREQEEESGQNRQQSSQL